MSVLTFISLASAPVSVLLSGMLIEVCSIQASFAISGTALAVTALTALLSPSLRAIEFASKEAATR